MTEPIAVGGEKKRDRRRLLAFVGVGLAAVVGGLVLPGLLFGGGETRTDSTPLPPPGGSAGITPTTLPAIADPPVETFEVFTTKNPFTPLVATGGAAAGADTRTDPGTGTAPATGTGSGTGTGTTNGGSTEPVSSQRVALLEVFTDIDGKVMGSVRVNDTVYEVTEGQTFASSYQAVTLSVADGSGVFLYGDDRFTLSEGEELLK